MDMKCNTISSESDGETIDSSVKILINDVTPCDSREFLHLPCSLLHTTSQGDIRFRKHQSKGLLQRRSSWSCTRCSNTFKPLHKSGSLGSLLSASRHSYCNGSIGLLLKNQLMNLKEDSSDSIPEGFKEKQRSFSAGSREDVFMFCNQLQDSAQSINDVMSENGSRLLTIKGTEPKPTKKHSLVTLGKNAHKEEWLITPRSTLQKSVSTPSIVAAQEIQEIAHRRNGKDRWQRSTLQNVRNSCIEIMHEDEEEPEEMNIKRLSSFSLANLLRENLLKSGAQEDEDKPFSKRKKRGSLFFRKKKNKEKENKKTVSSHQFVSICFSTSAICDVCSRALANKAALKCENCSVTIHDSSCKDHVPNCVPHKIHPPSTCERDSSSSLLTPSGSIRYPPRYRHLLGAPPLYHSHTSLYIGNKEKQSKEKRSSIGDANRINVTISESSKNPSSNTPRKNYTPSGYSQWRRVATKLGVNKVICEEKEAEPVEDVSTNILEICSASMESLEDASQGASDIEDEAMLLLLDDDPESWNCTVDRKILKKLKERDVKRQEAIYELILTEKHHCLTLKVMQRVFAKGMVQELNVSRDMVQRIFPCLEDLIRVHLAFLHKLRERQRMEPVVSQIGDIVLQQFGGQNAEELCSYYSQFCSQHKEALSLYKDIMKSDRKFQSFVKKCSTKSFCKARGIPECILLVTQRVTKYPLLIDALIKTSKDFKQEVEKLNLALNCVKNIVSRVNSAVAEKDREVRLLEIYNRIDAKSTAFYKRKKFKKSDLLSSNRKLRFEGILEWKSARGKIIEVHMIILSDVIVLLQENNQKYSFASLDNKAAVISLQKLLVREKAGANSRGIYLISSNPNDPEMYEMLCSSPKDKKLWLQIIRDSVTMLASEESKGFSSLDRNDSSADDEKSSKLAELCATMQEKDMEIATLCEEKIKAMIEALVLLGYDRNKIPSVDFQQILQKDEDDTEQCLVTTMTQASLLTSRMFFFDTNRNPSELVTSLTTSPVLPKRAETFSAYDNAGREGSEKANILKKRLMFLKDTDVYGDRELSSSDSSLHVKNKDPSSHLKFVSNQDKGSDASKTVFPQGTYNRLQELAELNYLLSASMSLLHHHLSAYRKEHSKRKYHPDHQLEELRNIQEKLSQERLQWEHDRAKQEKELNEKKEELLQLQKNIQEEKSRLQIYDISSTSPNLGEGKPSTLGCPSLGICKHKRSASYDFRTLGNMTQEIGGRQSWSGPVDDSSFMSQSSICSSQSTSNIPHILDGVNNKTNISLNLKSPESCNTSCLSVGTKDSDNQSSFCELTGSCDESSCSNRPCFHCEFNHTHHTVSQNA